MTQPEPEVEIVANELIRITLRQDGFEANAYVSSMHLIDDKIPQLRRVIQKQAQEAFLENQ